MSIDVTKCDSGRGGGSASFQTRAPAATAPPHTNDEPRRDKRKPSTAALWCYARLVITLGDPLQIHEHVMRGLASLVAVSSQAGLHEVFERGRRKRSPPVLEVTHARRHLVEHRPERVYVRTLRPLPFLRAAPAPCTKASQDRAFRGQRVLRRRKLRRRAARPRTTARPKSRSFTPGFVSSTFPGFKSRCTMP